MNEGVDPAQVVKGLEAFLAGFEKYGDALGMASTPASTALAEDAQARLQRKEPRITQLLVKILGRSNYTKGILGTCSTSDLLSNALISTGYSVWSEFVESEINRTIGAIQAGLWPPKTPTLVLVIHDANLRDRCSDLLESPGNYDRVIVEATRILEDWIRSKVGHEVLAQVLPASADQSGVKLIDTVFSPDKPILYISMDKGQRVAFHKMLQAVNSYIRNPSHHRLDEQTEWSWAWSAVGLVDRLLSDLEGCIIQPTS